LCNILTLTAPDSQPIRTAFWRTAYITNDFIFYIFLITKITEKELARKNDFNITLDFIYQQLEQFKIIDNIPENLEQRDSLLNRVLDVRSACMQYLTMNIRH